MIAEFDKARKTVASNVRALMGLHGMRTYAEVVARMPGKENMTPNSLSPYFLGKGNNLEVICSLAMAFGVSAADLLTDGFAEALRERMLTPQVHPQPVRAPEPKAATVDEWLCENGGEDRGGKVSLLGRPEQNEPRPRGAFNFNPPAEQRSTLLHMLDAKGIAVHQMRDALGLKSGQEIYNFMNSTGEVTAARRHIASYLAAKLDLSMREVLALRGRKGPPAG